MSDPEDIQRRFEELEAGRILGDLDAQERLEWEELAKDPRCRADLSLEFTAAAIETEFLPPRAEPLPATTLEHLRRDMARFVSPPPAGSPAERRFVWPGMFSNPQTAWAVAALFAILFAAKALLQFPANGTVKPAVATLSPEEARDILLRQAGDLVQSDFKGTDAFGQMSGKVIWSDQLQEGYLTLTRLAANTPSVSQYQLWIVDPSRDEEPVDGGVFDIPPDRETTVIRIRNPLAVNDPKAFVITLEQPGGVVVSKQEVVVAIAKTS
ncbi:MAG: anti-sigma factor [Verrucomicrobia bacterium]|nr:anti-sigma factor [Verrucomicrobiota bacterium]